MTKIKRAAPIIFLAIIFSFIFFYRLDYNTLESWDEAWYASIAREMVKTGNFIQMVWNGKPYYDHPPLGFWLIAISYKLFGVNELATRLPSTLLGFFSILLIYKVAHELFGKRVIGFVAALILGTSVWYVIRVRSGNLESVFIFFYLLTVFLSIKSAKNFNWFPLTMVSFAALILSKTLVGISAVFLILFFNIRQIINFKKNFLLLLFGVWLFVLTVFPWYNFHIKNFPGFIEYHFIHKGARDKTLASYFQLKIDQPLFYIHMGMRKWYRLWQVSILFALTNTLILFFRLITKKKSKKIFIYLLLIIWNVIVIYPFLTSEKTELWHLIPTYLPISLMVAFVYYDVGVSIFNFTLSSFEKIFKKFKFFRQEVIFQTLYLLLFLYLTAVQVYNFRKEVFPASRYVTDQVDIAKKIAKYNKKIFLDIDYLPVAVFYSGKHIETLVYEAGGEATFTRLFKEDNGNVIGVTKNWVIEDLQKKKFPLKLLEKNNTYSILTKP